MDRVFAALADPTRRALLARLGEAGTLSVSELARPLPVSLPAIMKHLDVLSDAGLIARRKSGRTVACRLTAAPMEPAIDWLNRYQRLWSEQLDRLAAFLEEPMSDKPRLTIKRRLKAPPAKVFSAWTDAEKLKLWFLSPQAEAVLTEVDARAGGEYRIVVRQAGGEENDVNGTFREVVADEKLVFTWAWSSTPERQSLVTIVLKPDGEGTLLTLTHEQFFDDAARDRHFVGWQLMLDRFEQTLPDL